MGTSPSHEEAHQQQPLYQGSNQQPVSFKLGGSNRSTSLPVNPERTFISRGSEPIQHIRNQSHGPMPSKPIQTTFNQQSHFYTQPLNPSFVYNIDQQAININNKFNSSSLPQENVKKTYQPSSRIYQNIQTINSSARMNPNYGSQVLTQASLPTQPVNTEEIKIDSRIRFSKHAPSQLMNGISPIYPAGSSVILFDSSAGQNNNSIIQNREWHINNNNCNKYPQIPVHQVGFQPIQQPQFHIPSQQLIQQSLNQAPVITSNPPPSSITLADRLKLVKKHHPQVSQQNYHPPQVIIQQNYEPKISHQHQSSFVQPTSLVPQCFPNSYQTNNTSISITNPTEHLHSRVISSSKKPFLNSLMASQVQQEQYNQMINPGILSKYYKEPVVTVDLLPITNNNSNDIYSKTQLSCQLDNKKTMINSPVNQNTRELKDYTKEEDSGTLAYSMSNNKKSSCIKNIIFLQSSEQPNASSYNMNSKQQTKSPGRQVAQRLDAFFNLGEDKSTTNSMRCREIILGSLTANSPKKDIQDVFQAEEEIPENDEKSRLKGQSNNKQVEEQDIFKKEVAMVEDKAIGYATKVDGKIEKITQTESQQAQQEQHYNKQLKPILRYEIVHGHSRRPSGNQDGDIKDHIRQYQQLNEEHPLIGINRQDINLQNSNIYSQEFNYKLSRNSIPQLNEGDQNECVQETIPYKILGEQKSHPKEAAEAYQEMTKLSSKKEKDLLASTASYNQLLEQKTHEFETNQSSQPSSRMQGEDIISKDSDDQMKYRTANIPKIQPSVQKKPEFSLEDRNNFLANLSYISFHLSKPGFHEQFSNSLNNTMCEESNSSRIENTEKCSSEEKQKKYHSKKMKKEVEKQIEQKNIFNLNLLQMMPSKVNTIQGQQDKSMCTKKTASTGKQDSKTNSSNSVVQQSQEKGSESKPSEMRLDISKQIEFQRIRALSCMSNEQLVDDIVSDDSNLVTLSEKNLEIQPQKFKNIDDLENIQVFIHFPTSTTSSSTSSTEENNQQPQQFQQLYKDQMVQQPISTIDSHHQEQMILTNQQNNKSTTVSLNNPMNSYNRTQTNLHKNTIEQLKCNLQKEEDKKINKIILEEISAVTQETFPSEKRQTMFLMNGQQRSYMSDLENKRKSPKEIKEIHEIKNIENFTNKNENLLRNNNNTTTKMINNYYPLANKHQQQPAHFKHEKQEQSKTYNYENKFHVNQQQQLKHHQNFGSSPLETQTFSEQDLSSTYLGTTLQQHQQYQQNNASSARSSNLRYSNLTKHANTAFNALSNSSRSRFTTFSEKDSEILFKYDPLTDSLFPISESKQIIENVVVIYWYFFGFEVMGRHSHSVDGDRHAVKKLNQEASRSSSAATNRQNNEEYNGNARHNKLSCIKQTEIIDNRSNKQRQGKNVFDKNSTNSQKYHLKTPYFQDANLYTSVLEKFSNLLVRQPQTAQKQKQQQQFTGGNFSVNQRYVGSSKQSNQKQQIHKNYLRK